VTDDTRLNLLRESLVKADPVDASFDPRALFYYLYERLRADDVPYPNATYDLYLYTGAPLLASLAPYVVGLTDSLSPCVDTLAGTFLNLFITHRSLVLAISASSYFFLNSSYLAASAFLFAAMWSVGFTPLSYYYPRYPFTGFKMS